MLSYDDMLEDSSLDARAREAELFGRSIALMREADGAGPGSSARFEAGRFTERLWTRLMEDLASSSNMLPAALRADLISIGIFMLRELEPAVAGRQRFEPLAAITEQLRAGLARA